MESVKALAERGYVIGEKEFGLGHLDGASLEVGLKAFSETVDIAKGNAPIFLYQDDPQQHDARPSARDIRIAHINSPAYPALCFQVIVLLQHYVELQLKHILREVHPLLAVDVGKVEAVVLHKLLNGESISETESSRLNAHMFGDALEHCLALLKEDRLSSDYVFILDNEKVLRHLNILRNRMWHRGTYILEYDALDRFVILHLLPLLKRLDLARTNRVRTELRMPPLSAEEIRDWSWGTAFGVTNCGVAPIAEMVGDGERGYYNVIRIAHLKELFRAKLRIPRLFDRNASGFDRMFQSTRYPILRFDEHLDSVFHEGAFECHVCGKNALIPGRVPDLWVGRKFPEV